MIFLQSLLFSLPIIYFILSLSVMMSHLTTYSYYNITYQVILSGNYIFSMENDKYIRLSRPSQVNNYYSTDEILYFKEGGSIKLIDGYIHNNITIWFDLYTLFWYFKIKKLIFNQSRLNLIRVR